MTPIDLTSAVARERTRDLTRSADRSRLAALASCCRPSALRGLGHRAGALVKRPATAVRPAPPAAATSCCGRA